MGYVLVMAAIILISMFVGYLFANFNRSEPKRIGDIYIMDQNIDDYYGLSMYVQLEAPLEDFDLQHGDTITMCVVDNRKKTQK